MVKTKRKLGRKADPARSLGRPESGSSARSRRGSLGGERVRDRHEMAQTAFVHGADGGVIPHAAGPLQAQHVILLDRAHIDGADQLAEISLSLIHI